MANLEDVLNGNAEPEILQVTTEAEPKGEEVTAPPAAEPPKIEPDPQMVPVAALQSERQKRQQLERELENIRNTAKPQEKPEDAEARFFENPVAIVDQRVRMAELNMSEQIARSAHQDYDEKLNVFADIVKQNPVFAQQMMQHAHPAEFAYQTAVKHLEFQKMQNPDQYKAEIKAELEKQLRAEFEQKFKSSASLPPDLAAARSAGANNQAPAWNGPPPFEDILKR